ncbi:hypothetical protein C7M52_04094 [Mixta theicola]|nr:hypothetical protein C7M52_04094 [Mixta theicola]
MSTLYEEIHTISTPVDAFNFMGWSNSGLYHFAVDWGNNLYIHESKLM